jgi:hypothetical protein
METAATALLLKGIMRYQRTPRTVTLETDRPFVTAVTNRDM